MVEKPFDKLGDHPMIQSGREDVIVPGIKILLEGIRHSDSERVVVSDFGVLAGFLAEFVQ
jgi:exopolyphosphatase/pppGpp-phosphohydrolase